MDTPPKILEAIRARPALYLGRKSLSGLRDFMNGYIVACADHGIGACHGIPEDFHDWAAYRTRCRESTAGWCHLITDATGSDERAFDRFFELLDEHANRRPSVFARFRNSTEQYSSWIDGGEPRTFRYPASIALVTYTDDLGFFALSEMEGQSFPSRNFIHSLDWFEAGAGGSGDRPSGSVRESNQRMWG